MTMDTPAAVVLELMTMVQQSAAHLGDLLPAASPHRELAAEILRCCGRVIDALRTAAAASGRKRKQAPEHHQEAAPPAAGAYWSPRPRPPPPPPGPLPKRR
jgi:hypothetical protein